MNSVLRVALLGSLLWLFAGMLFAQQQTVRVAHRNSIEVGMPIAEAIQVLRDCQIEFGEGWFEFTKSNADHEHLGLKLVQKHCYGCIFYSKSQQLITSLDMVFANSPGKVNQSWLPAKRITFDDDGNYTVTFLAPEKTPPKKK